MELIDKIYQKIKNKIEKKLKIYTFRQRILKHKKVTGNHQYSVVSAVYNIEKYLDDYFQSMVDQTLIFDKHIHLIMVDDGSTDSSAKIIKKWQQKYPKNITYIKKDNGGQASARNLGLTSLQTPWVTFIDPDDFVDVVYFEEVDKFLSKDDSKNVGLVCCKWVLYYEKDHSYSEAHPLNFRFDDGNRVVHHTTEKDFIPSSTATTFFKTSVINKFDIQFNEHIKPNFEDGYFSGRYVLAIDDLDAGYVGSAKYLYRKREDGSSTLDTSWENPSRFNEVLKLGYLGLFEEAVKNGYPVPLSIQRLVLYDLFWYFKRIINNPGSIPFLNPEQIEQFKKLCKQIFQYIDIKTIEDFDLAGCQYYHKVGLIGLYKQSEIPHKIIYIDAYDKVKNDIKIRYYHANKEKDTLHIDHKTMKIITQKDRRYDFLGELFIYEKTIWLHLNENTGDIKFSIGDSQGNIELQRNLQQEKISLIEIKEYFHMPSIGKLLNSIDSHLFTLNTPSKRGFKDSWLLIDRDNQADDNAEHLYRYINKNHPELNIYFILRKSSHDWERLKNEGFNLISFGTMGYLVALLQAKHLISSHADGYITDFIPRRFFKKILQYKFTFLQHGIIRDDISKWLNIKDIDCFVTSTPQEYKSIIEDESKYKFTSREVVLTGLARHDRLLFRSEPTEKVILIIPTWRQSFVGATEKNSAKRTQTDAFYDSSYAKHWKSLLHSDKLKMLADQYGYTVVFFPHANMQIYIDWFDAPSWIEVRTHKTDPILHKLFRRSAIMITDYSSVFFEFAVLQKALIYYQFDYDFMYGGEQQSQLGYFDFHKDGFGPACKEENEVLFEIEHLLKQNAKPDEEYLTRMKETFPYRDGHNCQRIYQAISNLHNKMG